MIERDVLKCLSMATRIPVRREQIAEWAKAISKWVPCEYAYHQNGVPYYRVLYTQDIPFLSYLHKAPSS